MDTQPLKVTFTIKSNSPIREPMHLIHLDALLAWSRVQQAVEENDSRGFEVQHDLPLERLTSKDGHWVFAASALHYAPFMRELRYWSRKTDLGMLASDREDGLLALRANKISTSSGPWKQASQFEPLLHIAKAEAWCIGNKEAIETLLERVKFIGKRRSRGYGETTKISVEYDNSANEKVNARVFSWQRTPQHIEMECGTKPPYWKVGMGFYPTKQYLRQIFANNS